MKDLIIKSKSIKRELRTWLILFIIANGVNVYAIITYKTPWTELYLNLGFVGVIFLSLYIIVTIVRLLIVGIRRLVKGASS